MLAFQYHASLIVQVRFVISIFFKVVGNNQKDYFFKLFFYQKSDHRNATFVSIFCKLSPLVKLFVYAKKLCIPQI